MQYETCSSTMGKEERDQDQDRETSWEKYRKTEKVAPVFPSLSPCSRDAEMVPCSGGRICWVLEANSPDKGRRGMRGKGCIHRICPSARTHRNQYRWVDEGDGPTGPPWLGKRGFLRDTVCRHWVYTR